MPPYPFIKVYPFIRDLRVCNLNFFHKEKFSSHFPLQPELLKFVQKSLSLPLFVLKYMYDIAFSFRKYGSTRQKGSISFGIWTVSTKAATVCARARADESGGPLQVLSMQKKNCKIGIDNIFHTAANLQMSKSRLKKTFSYS